MKISNFETVMCKSESSQSHKAEHSGLILRKLATNIELLIVVVFQRRSYCTNCSAPRQICVEICFTDKVLVAHHKRNTCIQLLVSSCHTSTGFCLVQYMLYMVSQEKLNPTKCKLWICPGSVSVSKD